MTDEEKEAWLWRTFAAACMNCGRVREPTPATPEPWICDRCDSLSVDPPHLEE